LPQWSKVLRGHRYFQLLRKAGHHLLRQQRLFIQPDVLSRHEWTTILQSAKRYLLRQHLLYRWADVLYRDKRATILHQYRRSLLRQQFVRFRPAVLYYRVLPVLRRRVGDLLRRFDVHDYPEVLPVGFEAVLYEYAERMLWKRRVLGKSNVLREHRLLQQEPNVFERTLRSIDILIQPQEERCG
jgi:hypothetical protein